MSTDRRLLGAAVFVLLCTGCGGVATDSEATAPPLASSSPAVTAHISSITLPTPTQATPATGLDASFAELANSLAGQIGVAYLPVGGDGPAVTLGDWSTGPAWSTIKVPLAVAAFRHEGAAAEASARPAITASDNDAAEQLWESLGPPETAAAAVETVLREAGDETTVESQRVRPGFSAFGQTVWSLAAQTGFAAELPCLPMAAPVVDLMGSVVADQQWGLAQIPDAVYKAGWGPDAVTGGYLVRQFGLVPTATGRAAVAIVAVADSGTFADGTAMLDRIGTWLGQHVAELPGGDCT